MSQGEQGGQHQGGNGFEGEIQKIKPLIQRKRGGGKINYPTTLTGQKFEELNNTRFKYMSTTRGSERGVEELPFES